VACPVNSNENHSYRKVLLSDQIGINAVSSMGFAKQSKAELPLIEHYHKNKMEFVIAVDGFQQYKTGGVDFTIYQSEIFITTPSEVHACVKTPQSVNTLMWFQIDISKASAENFLGQTGQTASMLYDRVSSFDARCIKLDPLLLEQFVEAFHLICGNNLQKLKGQSLFIYSILSLLEQKAVLKTLSKDVDYAKQYILLHCKETIGINELLKKSDLSASAFKQKFKQQLGITPREYIDTCRIECSKRNVAFSKQSFTDIAFEYSFSSKKKFVSAFKQNTGCSPRKYRRNPA